MPMNTDSKLPELAPYHLGNIIRDYSLRFNNSSIYVNFISAQKQYNYNICYRKIFLTLKTHKKEANVQTFAHYMLNCVPNRTFFSSFFQNTFF